MARTTMMAAFDSDAPATIVWFRRDLRTRDQPALDTAAQAGNAVLPLYILDPDAGRAPGAAGLWWLDKSLRALAAACTRLGSPLVLRRGASLETLLAVAADVGARRIVTTRLYDRASIRLEEEIADAAAAAGIVFEALPGALLRAPWELKTGAGGGFRVFKPFWRALEASVGKVETAPEPSRLRPPGASVASDALDDWGLHPRRPDWSAGFEGRPGEEGAQEALRRFVDARLSTYHTARDRPGEDGSSRLSAHLHWGELSPRQVWRAISDATTSPEQTMARDKYLSEIGWRDFAYHVLFHHPDLADVEHNTRVKALRWRRAPEEFEAWTRGRTGHPIVDAGLRQVWATGWMHNRVRMITASFLCKDLLIDWRDGERWFWDTLVDADEANNPLNWQWVAGSGPDASPFFRVFNPTTQGETFDPAGEYIRKWVPELAALPASAIHTPWTASAEVLERAGVRLGTTYPPPIVDHAQARLRALAAFKATAAA